ncbi:STAS domain-containing protein [Microbispora sp. NPDC088329]|uniref:STAS domain-containing protein n=1 Tax=Microbispora sp. NPDC088329 TaxID=3154869 RepID=UPI0034443143
MGPEVPPAFASGHEPPRQEAPHGGAAASPWTGLTRIIACGEIDMCTAGRLHGGVLDVLRRQRPDRIEIDLAGVTFLDASGVRALLKSRAAAAKVGCRLTVVEPGRMARRILEIVGLLETFGLAAAPPDSPRCHR